MKATERRQAIWSTSEGRAEQEEETADGVRKEERKQEADRKGVREETGCPR